MEDGDDDDDDNDDRISFSVNRTLQRFTSALPAVANTPILEVMVSKEHERMGPLAPASF